MLREKLQFEKSKSCARVTLARSAMWRWHGLARWLRSASRDHCGQGNGGGFNPEDARAERDDLPAGLPGGIQLVRGKAPFGANGRGHRRRALVGHERDARRIAHKTAGELSSCRERKGGPCRLANVAQPVGARVVAAFH